MTTSRLDRLCVFLVAAALAMPAHGQFFGSAGTLRAGGAGEPTAIVTTADGELAYWGGDPQPGSGDEGGITVSRRIFDTEWVTVEVVREAGGVSLLGAVDLALSADERQLYALTGDTLLVFWRDIFSGTLTFAAAHSGHFTQAKRVLRGQLPGWLYVGARNRVVAFQRDPQTGVLGNPQAVAETGFFFGFEVSADREHLIGAGEPALRLFSLRDGLPSLVSTVDNFEVDGHTMDFVERTTSTRANGQFYAYGNTVATVQIANDQLNVVGSIGDTSFEIVYSAMALIDDSTLAIGWLDTNGGRDQLHILDLRADGTVAERTILSGLGLHHRQGIRAIAPVPGLEADFLIGAFRGATLNRVFWNGTSWQVTSVARTLPAPTATAWAPGGGHFFVGRANGEIHRIERTALGPGVASPPLNTGFLEWPATDLELTPDGSRLAVLNASGFTDAAVVELYAYDAVAGKLTWVDREVVDGGHALAFSPDGGFLYTNEGYGFRVGPSSLTRLPEPLRLDPLPAEPRIKADQAGSRVRISPDGRRLYEIANRDVFPFFVATLFWRDPATGQLEEADPAAYDNALDHAVDVAFSPEGRHVYALRANPGSQVDPLRLVAFRWNDATRRHESIASYDAGLSQPGISQPPEVAIDPFGRAILYTGTTQGKVAVYDRDPDTGALAFRDLLDLQPGSVSPTERTLSLAFGPAGEAAVAIGRLGNVELLGRHCPSWDERSLCLDQQRFIAELEWQTRDGNYGPARRVDFLPDTDSGLLYFFSDNNWELLIKVLDGCALNGHHWVFAAGTTDVGYRLRVVDRVLGLHAVYEQAPGEVLPALTDTQALACKAPFDPLPSTAESASEPSASAAPAHWANAVPASAAGNVLELDGFDVRLRWTTPAGQQGDGAVVPFQSDDSGLFTFFSPNNWEALVKVLDGCAINNRHWLFAAAATNVGFELAITQESTGITRIWSNPAGVNAPAIIDTNAFTCP